MAARLLGSGGSRMVFAAQVLAVFITGTSTEITCVKKDICSCEMSDGSGTISLWPADGGKSGPSFKGIKEKLPDKSVFDWNPCTPFTSTKFPERCKDTMICQNANYYFSCGTKSTSFTVEGGDVIIEYGLTAVQDDHQRKTQVTLKCDKSVKGKGVIPMISEKTAGKVITYKGEFTSQYACPKKSLEKSSGLSTGSTLLIVFFSLLLVYIVGGMLINRYQRGIESVPEMCPNHSFWADFPVLVKDGVVFSFTSLVRCCKSAYAKCNQESYASI